MNWSIILGVIGILVSVIVGWVTYHLADKRQRRNRYLSAKNAILLGLARTLSEQNIPSYEIVRATIRSILREENASESEISVDEIVEDLVHQVTFDPFLPPERRRELQTALLGIGPTTMPDSRPVDAEEVAEPSLVGEEAASPRNRGGWHIPSIVASVLASLISFAVLRDILPRLATSTKAVVSEPNPRIVDAVAAGGQLNLLVAIVLIVLGLGILIFLFRSSD